MPPPGWPPNPGRDFGEVKRRAKTADLHLDHHRKRKFVQMMKSVLSATAMSAVVMIGAAPANAAWSCSGPQLACAGKASVKKASVATAKPATRVSKKSRTQASSKRKTTTAKYAVNKAKSRPVTSVGGGSTGVASYYWQPQRVASGGWFNPNALTAAHKTLPFGTRVQVTNLSNGRAVTVTINDRGPYIKGRVIDLSRAAASAIGMTGAGVARVSYAIVGRS
jgi:rare lipoprotein A